MKNKWKCVLKDGMIHINGKDYLFAKCTGYVPSWLLPFSMDCMIILGNSNGSVQNTALLSRRQQCPLPDPWHHLSSHLCISCLLRLLVAYHLNINPEIMLRVGQCLCYHYQYHCCTDPRRQRLFVLC